jgi:hypothetical protein
MPIPMTKVATMPKITTGLNLPEADGTLFSANRNADATNTLLLPNTSRDSFLGISPFLLFLS